MLRTILEEDELVVQDVITQNSEKNLYGRSVRLDALCTLGNGEKCNIEIQRSDNDDHLRRVRYNASSITLRDSQIGTKFDKIPEVYVVFISEFDVFKMGKTVYHVDNVIRETKKIVQDGLHRIFVNTEIDDGTKTSRLMSHFTEKTVEDVEAILNTKDSSSSVGFQNGTTGQFYCEGDESFGFAGFKMKNTGYANGSLAVQDLINGGLKYVIIDAAPAQFITESINKMQ